MFGSRNNNNRNSSPFGSNRPVCQFYLEGRCRFGDSCKNEHPAGQGGGNQNQNRFASLNNDNQPRGRSGAFGGNQQQNSDEPPYNLRPDVIKLDLTDERPQWPLSSYGPGKNAPRQLLEANFENSPEEMRVLHYMNGGNTQETAQREASLMQNIDNEIRKILNDLPGAVKYVVDGQNQHPNRNDLADNASSTQPAQQTSNAFGSQQTSTFGQPSAFGKNTTTSAFGQPSALGKASPFAQPSGQASAFGQPSALGQRSSFGQPSQPAQTTAFGQPSQPAQTTFGQPSQPAQTSAFGQPSALGQSSAFGKPSALGAKPAFGQPAFGQPSQPNQQPGFGQPSQTSAFGQPSQPTSTFGKPSPFGQAAANQTSGFASKQASPFASAGAGQQQSAFGQPSAFGALNKPSPFAAAAQQNQSAPAFGSPSPFGAAATNPTPFGAAQPQPQSNPFGSAVPAQKQSSPFGAPAANQSAPAFGQPSQPAKPSPFAAAAPQNNASASQQGNAAHLTRDGTGRLTAFKGVPVVHNQENNTVTVRNPTSGKSERVWFPNGPPGPSADAQADDELYVGDLGEALKTMYDYVAKNGVFENGIMPEVPPLREWVAFDL